MPGKVWATEEQIAWMSKRLPTFVEAQRENTTEKFFAVTHSEWFHRFDLDDPTPEEVEAADGDKEKAQSKKAKAQRKQVRWWFYNRTRGASSRRVLNLTKKRTGYLHPYQAYLSLYKERVMPIINTQYYMYRVKLGKDEEAEAELTFRAKAAKELLAKEPDDVQRRVEQFREFKRKRAKEGMLGPVIDTDASPDEEGGEEAMVEELVKNLGSLPATLDHAIKNLSRLTGWIGFAVFAGPHPRTGAMMTVAAHAGKTLREGLKFEEVSPDAHQALMDSFTSYADMCFPSNLTDALTIMYRESQSADKDSENAQPMADGRSPHARKSDKSKGPTVAAQVGVSKKAVRTREKTSGTTTKVVPGMGESLHKQSQPPTGIASATVADGPGDEGEEAAEDVDAEADEDRDVEVNLEGVGKDAHTDGGCEDEEGGQVDVGANDQDVQEFVDYETQRRLNIEANRELLKSLKLLDVQVPKKNGKGKARAVSHGSTGQQDVPLKAPRMSTRSKSKVDGTGTSIGGGSDRVMATPGGDDTIVETSVDPSALPTPTAPASLPEAPACTTPTVPRTAPPAAAAPTSATSATVAVSPTPAATNAHSTPLDTFALEEGSTSASRGVDPPVREEIVSAAPEWMAEANAYLVSISQDERWQEAVQNWVKLEELLGYPSGQGPDSRLPTKNRPMQVRQWIQTHRQYEKIPVIGGITVYGAEWALWWRALQPDGRLDAEGELQRIEETEGGISWSVLRRGGPNGFFLVLLALSWWVASAGDDEDPAIDVFSMVEDVCWVLGRLLTEDNVDKGRVGSDKDNGEGVKGKGRKRLAERSATVTSPDKAKRTRRAS